MMMMMIWKKCDELTKKLAMVRENWYKECIK